MPWVSRFVNGSSISVSPKSRIAFVKNLKKKRATTAFPPPPIYWSTGIQHFTTSLLKGLLFSLGEAYLKKYHDESTKVSIVSASLLAGFPHFGHFTFINFSDWARGEAPSPVSFTSSGRTTGRSLYGTGTTPQLSQYIIGIGQPQYLCLDMPQSLNL